MINQYELSGKAGQLLMEVLAAFPDRDDCADNMNLVCMTQASIKKPSVIGVIMQGRQGSNGRQARRAVARWRVVLRVIAMPGNEMRS